MKSVPPLISWNTVFGRVEGVPALVDVGQIYRRADLERTRVGRLATGDHPKQGGLAGSVGPDNADDPSRRKGEREVIDQQPVSVSLVNVIGDDHLFAQAPGEGDLDLEPIGPLIPRSRLCH